MATTPINTTDIFGITGNKLPTGTYIDKNGNVAPIVDQYGIVTFEGSTNNTSQPLTLNGTFDNASGNTLEVTDTVLNPLDGTPIAAPTQLSVRTNPNGTWTATTAGTLAQGDHHFVATTYNSSHQVVSSDTFDELVRTSAGGRVPDQPVLTAISDAHDSIGTDNLIANHDVVFHGKADAYALITVYVGTSPFGGGTAVADQVQADADGNWTVIQDNTRGVIPETAKPGELTYVQVTATDLAGNSAANQTTSYVVDMTNPGVTFNPVGYTDSSGQHDTNVQPVTFSGTVTDDHGVDSVVVNTFTNGVATGHITATVDATTGAWTASANLTAEGLTSFTVTATDKVGNQTTLTNGTTFVYDHTAPTVSADLEYTTTDLVPHTTTVDQTSNGAVTLTATVSDALSAIKSVEVFDTVTVNGVTTTTDLGAETIVTGTGAAATTTTYSFNHTLGQGTHVIHEEVTDIAGNVTIKPSYTPLIVDTTAPSVTSTTETYGIANATHAAGATVDALTNDPNIRLTIATHDAGGSVTNDGTGISSVAIFDGNNLVPVGSATYSGTGDVWTFNTSTLGEGAHTLHAEVTDAVGNVTKTANLASFTLDTVAPTAPSVTLATDSGSSSTDLYSNPDSVTVTAEAGSTVNLYYDGSTTVSATATVSGTYVPGGTATGTVTIDPHFVDGVAHTVVVTATDAANNVSAPSTTLTYTVDTVAPAVTIANTTQTLSDNGSTLNATHNTATFSVAFDEAPKNLDGTPHTVTAADFTLSGGTIASVVQTGNDAQHYTVTVTNTAQGNAVTDTLTYNAHTVYDQAGNANVAASATATGDTESPVAPIITDVDGSPYTFFLGSSPFSTAVTVSGIAEANSIVTLYDTAQNDYQNYPTNGGSPAGIPSGRVVLGTTTADSAGHFSLTPTNPFSSIQLASDQTHILTATATDGAGNVSAFAQNVAAAVLSSGDTYNAASALNKSVLFGFSEIGQAVASGTPYFIVGDASNGSTGLILQSLGPVPPIGAANAADLINAGRSSTQVINDEYSTNSTIIVGASTFSLVRGGQGASITAGSGANVFAIDNVLGHSASPDAHAQSIHQFNANDKIDVSEILTRASSIEIDQTATGSTLIVRGDIGGGTTVVNVDGSHLTASQVITATSDIDYYKGVASLTSATTASLITSVAIDGTKTEIASGAASAYAIALDAGSGYILQNGAVATLAGVGAVTFADGTLSFDTNGLTAQVYRAHLAAFGTVASASDLATGTTFLSSGHTLSQLSASYLASPTLVAEASLTNQQFVDQTYHDAFGRTADAGGEAMWTNALNTGSLTRADVIAAFSQSGEAHFLTDATVTHGLFSQSNTTEVYELLYGRVPTPSELAAGDASGLNAHDLLVQQTGTPTFYAAVTAAAPNHDYTSQSVVEYLYEEILHRPADTGGLAYWSGVLDTSNQTAGDIAYAIAESGEGLSSDSYHVALANGAANITAPVHAAELLAAIFGAGTSDSHFAMTVSDLQHGATLVGEANSLIASDAALANDSTSDFVNTIYSTALGRPADTAGAAFWTDQIDHHGLAKGAFVSDVIDSVEFQSHFDPHTAIVAAAMPPVLIP